MWFDWRMIFVVILLLAGVIAAMVGLLLLLADAFGVVSTNPVKPTPAPFLLTGVGFLVAGILLGVWCNKNPDAGT